MLLRLYCPSFKSGKDVWLELDYRISWGIFRIFGLQCLANFHLSFQEPDACTGSANGLN